MSEIGERFRQVDFCLFAANWLNVIAEHRSCKDVTKDGFFVSYLKSFVLLMSYPVIKV